jgi:hypothetical protein
VDCIFSVSNKRFFLGLWKCLNLFCGLLFPIA